MITISNMVQVRSINEWKISFDNREGEAGYHKIIDWMITNFENKDWIPVSDSDDIMHLKHFHIYFKSKTDADITYLRWF